MRLKVIIVDPKYQMNVGYIARISKNFGVKQLSFVEPRADIRGGKALMYAKHAADLLNSANVYKSIDEATEGCDVVVGTTGVWREGTGPERTYLLRDVVRSIKKGYRHNSTVGLLIGRDDKGLNREELARCDLIAHIGSNKKYSTLNISHALAILLYALTGDGFKNYLHHVREFPKKEEEAVLFNAFEKLIKGKKIRDKEGVRRVFARMVRKSQLVRHELHALITALK